MTRSSGTTAAPAWMATFPGGAVDLTYRFGPRDGGIASLEVLSTKGAES